MKLVQFEKNQEPDLNPLLGPIETFALNDVQNGLNVSPLKSRTYFLLVFLIFASAFIFSMSFDTNLENRPLVRVLIFLMTFCCLGCAYLVFKKGLASLQFTRGGRFVEYLNGNGHARLLDAQDLGLNLIKETIPETMDSKGYDQFKLLVGNDTLLRTKSLTHMNELIHKVEVIGFKVNRNF